MLNYARWGAYLLHKFREGERAPHVELEADAEEGQEKRSKLGGKCNASACPRACRSRSAYTSNSSIDNANRHRQACACTAIGTYRHLRATVVHAMMAVAMMLSIGAESKLASKDASTTRAREGNSNICAKKRSTPTASDVRAAAPARSQELTDRMYTHTHTGPGRRWCRGQQALPSTSRSSQP